MDRRCPFPKKVRKWIHKTGFLGYRRLRASSVGADTIHILNSWLTLDIEQAFRGEGKKWLEKSTKSITKDSGPRNKYFPVDYFLFTVSFPLLCNSHTHTER